MIESYLTRVLGTEPQSSERTESTFNLSHFSERCHNAYCHPLHVTGRWHLLPS